jgi:aryl-alcohol dehydrogenase-like predicted oxidoreductase
MKIGRRKFLKGAIVGAGGLLLGCETSAPIAGPAKAALPANFAPDEVVTLGKTGIQLTRVGIGTGMKGGQRSSNQVRLGKKAFEALLRGAYDRGVRWFDMADMYGSHPYLGPALKGIPRDKYVMVSKVWWRRGALPERERPVADVVVQRFLKELRADYIDLVLLHCVTSPTWPADLRPHMDALARLKAKGLIRAHGVSCHSVPALAACAAEPWVDSVHARINPYGVKMDGPPEKVVPILKKIHGAGKGVVGMKIIGEGEFANSDERRDASVRYVLGLGCVDVMTVGFEKVAEIDDFAARVRKVPRTAAAPKKTA